MKRKKSIIAAIAIAIMCLMPLFSMAQILKLDGVATERQTGDGGWEPSPGVDPGTGEYAPLGSGLWVLAASAGLYLLVKSKKKRRTKTVMLAALALTLGTTQCHKPTQTETVNGNGNEPEERTIHISLTTGNIFNPKTDMNLYDGKITWNKDDKVYVVCGGKLLSEDALEVEPSSNPVFGTIKGSITVSQFGDITDPVFTFYYVGKGVNFTPAKNATSLTFDIANQKKAGCDVGEYMIGRTAPIQMEKKTDANTYVAKETVTFKPITSVVWLNTSDFGTGDMQLVGANALNTMTINLGNPNNLIGKHSANISFTGGDKAVVSVMPATAADAPDDDPTKVVLVFNGNNKSGSLDMNFGIKPGIEYARIDGSLRSPLDIAGIEGAIPGLFSVSATKQVYFSKGNLWYDKTPNSGQPYWGFEANQYDFRTWPAKGSCINGSYKTSSGTPTDTYGLFGWGDVPENGDPIKHTKYVNDYTWSVDWGTKIGDGSTWRTLTGGPNEEWEYLIDKRTDDKAPEIKGNTDCRCAMVMVNTVPGLMVFPDVFTWPASVTPIPTTFNEGSPDWNDVNYTDTQFAALEAEGVVFLPATGYRDKNNNYYAYGVGVYACYQSQNLVVGVSPSDDGKVYNLDVSPSVFDACGFNKRYKGFPVRLVAEKKN